MSRERFSGETTYWNDAEWRRAFNAWLDKEGRGAQEALRKQLGITHTSLIRLKDGTVNKSTLIGPISRITGIPLPGVADEEMMRASDMLTDLRTRDRAAFDALLRVIEMTAASKKPR